MIRDFTERQFQDKEDKWSHKYQSPKYDDYAKDSYYLTGEDHAIPQGVADGNVSVYGHDCQHHRLQASAYVNYVHLCDARIQTQSPWRLNQKMSNILGMVAVIILRS